MEPFGKGILFTGKKGGFLLRTIFPLLEEKHHEEMSGGILLVRRVPFPDAALTRLRYRASPKDPENLGDDVLFRSIPGRSQNPE